MIYVADLNETIDLIFFKLMFYFDLFQPGDIRFWNTANHIGRKPILKFDPPISIDHAKKIAVKSGEGQDAPIIFMAHVYDYDENVHAIIIVFSRLAYEPQLIVKETDRSIGLGCDEGGHKLRNDMSKTEEKEAFEFFIQIVKSIITECTGNLRLPETGEA